MDLKLKPRFERLSNGLDSELGIMDYGVAYRILGPSATEIPSSLGKKNTNCLEVYAGGRTLWLDNSVDLKEPFGNPRGGPRSGALHVKGAITEAAKAKVVVADALAVAPYAGEAASLWGMGTGKWPFLGELSGEMEISDSVTGERLFAGVDNVVGSVDSNTDPTARWDDVREGFNLWRDRIGKRMASCRETGSFKMPEDERSWMKKTYEYISP